MDSVFSANFWIQIIASTLFTMLMIYVIKKFSTAYDIPVVKELSSAI